MTLPVSLASLPCDDCSGSFDDDVVSSLVFEGYLVEARSSNSLLVLLDFIRRGLFR